MIRWHNNRHKTKDTNTWYTSGINTKEPIKNSHEKEVAGWSLTKQEDQTSMECKWIRRNQGYGPTQGVLDILRVYGHHDQMRIPN